MTTTSLSSPPRTDRHAVDVAADADHVYDRLVDVSRWPEMFDPTIHACELRRRAGVQSIRLWATANGEPKSWTSDRELDDDARTIGFAQVVSAPPVAEMSGLWRVVPTEQGCRVELDHAYRSTDGPGGLDWIARAVDRNSRAELDALRSACERSDDADDAPFTFSDSVDTDADPGRVFDFLDRGELWAERLAHVDRSEMQEFGDGLQHLRMSTLTPDGGSHVTESFRVSQAPSTLVYKQTTLPALLSLHTGTWSIRPAGERWRVTSTHTVAVRADAVARVLGEDATVQDARALARRNLGSNSARTLDAAVAASGGSRSVR